MAVGVPLRGYSSTRTGEAPMAETNDKDKLTAEGVALAANVVELLRATPVNHADLVADDYDAEAQSIEEYLQSKQPG